MDNSDFQIHEIRWQNIDIQITHKPRCYQIVSHIEVRSNEVLPITNTGYRSIFLPPEVIEQAGGPISVVMQMLEEDATSQQWKQHSLL